MHTSGMDGSAHLQLEPGRDDEERAAGEQCGRHDPQGEELDEPEHASCQEQHAGPEADEPTLAGQQAPFTGPCRRGWARPAAPR